MLKLRVIEIVKFYTILSLVVSCSLYIMLPLGKMKVWPSGLRRQLQVLVSQEAWVRTPPLSISFMPANYQIVIVVGCIWFDLFVFVKIAKDYWMLTSSSCIFYLIDWSRLTAFGSPVNLAYNIVGICYRTTFPDVTKFLDKWQKYLSSINYRFSSCLAQHLLFFLMQN